MAPKKTTKLMPTPSEAKATTKLVTRRAVCVIGAPLALGQDCEGVQEAPTALRGAGLLQVIASLGWEGVDEGDLDLGIEKDRPTSGVFLEIEERKSGEYRPQNNTNDEHQQAANKESRGIYNQAEIPRCSLIGKGTGRIADAVENARRRGDFVLVLGGDHSIAGGSIAGLVRVHPDLAVVLVDAHGDINTPETSPSHNYHGMFVGHLLGLFRKRSPGFAWMEGSHRADCHGGVLAPNKLAYIGLRDVDEGEKLAINNSEIAAYTMKHVDAHGIGALMKAALERIDPMRTSPIHLSFDIDACDPSFAPGTGTRARGGLTYREVGYT